MSKSHLEDTPPSERAKKIHQDLTKPFRPDRDVLWVVNNADKNGNWVICSPYIQKESAEERADQVLGPENWEDEITWPNDTGFFFYTLWFRMPGAEEWRKRTVSGQISTDGFGEGEEFNIEVSFAEKRAWRKLGIGRYLYRVGDCFADHVQTKSDPELLYYKPKNGKALYFRPPKLPDFALPEGFEYNDKSGRDRGGKGTNKKEEEEIPEASNSQWEKIENLLKQLNDEDVYEQWVDALYKDKVNEQTAEVVGQVRKRIPGPKAFQVIKKLESQVKNKGTNESKEKSKKNKKPEPPGDGPDGKEVAESAYGDAAKGEPED